MKNGVLDTWSDPGPVVDTYKSQWIFQDIKPGTKYVSLKYKRNGYWSDVSYWTVSVPNLTSSITKKIVPKSTNTPTQRVIKQSSYTCNCSKTCPNMSSCQEAYYQLNECGCSQRDGDNDGIPCENVCK